MSVVLPGGMAFAFERCTSPVACCAVHVKSGTRHEPDGMGGLAHFAEHLLFKGTEGRKASTVNAMIERLGGELNAYTTKEETVIHATVLKEDLPKAIDLLMDISFRCVFPEKEIEKERSVVLEEINTYKDSPSEQIFDDFEELLFKGTPLSMPVLGKAASLRRIRRSTVEEYYRKCFVPSNMFFTATADLPEEKVLGVVLRYLDKYCPAAYAADSHVSGQQDGIPEELGYIPPFCKTVNRRSHQVHCIIGARSFSAYRNERVPAGLLVNILGGPVANSRLNVLLRERNGLVYSVDASIGLYSDSGVASIYFGCEKSNVRKCEKLIGKVLEEMISERMSDRTLKGAKKQFLGQMTIASDGVESKTLSMGKSLMMYGRVISLDESRELIEQVTAEDVRCAAESIFAEGKLSKLLYV